MQGKRLPRLFLLTWALVVMLATSCGGEGEATAEPSAPPKTNEPPIDVVVVIELRNNPTFDLMAREINGVNTAGQFDQDASNNMEEPLVIPPGRIRFFIDNLGTLAHGFQVNSPDGTKIAKTRNVGPQKTGELIVDLAPGSYLAFCPLSDHAKRGSQRTLIVDPKAQFPPPPLK